MSCTRWKRAFAQFRDLSERAEVRPEEADALGNKVWVGEPWRPTAHFGIACKPSHSARVPRKTLIILALEEQTTGLPTGSVAKQMSVQYALYRRNSAGEASPKHKGLQMISYASEAPRLRGACMQDSTGSNRVDSTSCLSRDGRSSSAAPAESHP